MHVRVLFFEIVVQNLSSWWNDLLFRIQVVVFRRFKASICWWYDLLSGASALGSLDLEHARLHNHALLHNWLCHHALLMGLHTTRTTHVLALWSATLVVFLTPFTGGGSRHVAPVHRLVLLRLIVQLVPCLGSHTRRSGIEDKVSNEIDDVSNITQFRNEDGCNMTHAREELDAVVKTDDAVIARVGHDVTTVHNQHPGG